MVIINPSM